VSAVRPTTAPRPPPRGGGGPGGNARTRHVVAAVLVFVCLAVAVALHATHRDALVTLLPSPDMHELHVDFDTFRLSAVQLVQGGDIYHTAAKLRNLNPPLLTVLLAPAALLDAVPAYRLFAALTLLMVLGAVLAVTRELRLSRGVTAAVAATVLASSPLHGTLVLGQIYGILLVGLVAGWVAERRGRPLLAAACYGVTVALKPSLAPLLLLPVVLRRWRPAAAGGIGAVAATLLGVLVAGVGSGLEWLRIGLAEPVPDSVDNASLPGLAVRYGVPSAVGTAVGLAVLGGTLAVLARRRDRVDPAGAAPFAVLAAGLLVSPIAWHNYLMLLWPGILVLLDRHGRSYRPGRAAVLLAVTVVPVSWNAIWPPEGGWASLGRSLYCAVLLTYWWVLLASASGSVASPTATGRSVTSEPSSGSSTTASGAPGVNSSAGGSAS
jgi:alpha-1,2-mannosyltransferase